MRKLLILIVVLGVTSMASAALTLMVSDSGDAGTYYDPPEASSYFVNESDYIWIGIYNDADGSVLDPRKGQYFLALESTPGATWTGAWQQYKPPLVANAPDNYMFGSPSTYMPYGIGNVDVWMVNTSDGDPATWNLQGVLDAKELHSSLAGSSETVYLLDQALTILDTITIHQIPEPITIALLGLGGLFLRRRK